jgi:hypothetical protein
MRDDSVRTSGTAVEGAVVLVTGAAGASVERWSARCAALARRRSSRPIAAKRTGQAASHRSSST